MTRYNNGSEGGTPGDVITGATSGGASGDAWDVVIDSPTFDNTHAMHGAVSMLCPAGATASYAYWSIASTNLALRFYAYFTAAPTAEYSMARIYNTTPSIALQVNLLATGKLRVYGSGGAVIVTFASNMPLNQWVRIEVAATQSATATVTAAYYVGDSSTPVDSLFTTSTANTGTVGFGSVRFGKINTTGLDAHWIDSCAVETAAAGALIGTPAASVPVAFAGSDVAGVEPWDVVGLTGDGVPAEGALITGYAWTQTAGVTALMQNATTNQPSVTPAGTRAAGTSTFSLVVTDSLGGVSAPDTVNVTTLPATELVVIGGVLTPYMPVVIRGAAPPAAGFGVNPFGTDFGS